MLRRLLVAFVTLSIGSIGSIGLLACKATVNDTGTSSGSSSGGSTGGATTVEIDSCHQSCDQMKFFGCNSADEQAACYSDCASATPSEIQVFGACAMTSICDPACRNDIAPKPPSGGPVTGTGATPSSCGTACTKLVSCSFIPVGDQSACVSQCQSQAYQYQIDCVNNTACASLQKTCGGGSSTGVDIDASVPTFDAGDPIAEASISRCQSSCDQLLGQQCIGAADQATCRSTCAATTSAARDTFSSCVEQSSSCTTGADCYSAF